jgi:hypothetical protein
MVFGWQAVFVVGTGLVAGAAAGTIPFGLMSRREPTLAPG